MQIDPVCTYLIERCLDRYTLYLACFHCHTLMREEFNNVKVVCDARSRFLGGLDVLVYLGTYTNDHQVKTFFKSELTIVCL